MVAVYMTSNELQSKLRVQCLMPINAQLLRQHFVEAAYLEWLEPNCRLWSGIAHWEMNKVPDAAKNSITIHLTLGGPLP